MNALPTLIAQSAEPVAPGPTVLALGWLLGSLRRIARTGMQLDAAKGVVLEGLPEVVQAGCNWCWLACAASIHGFYAQDGGNDSSWWQCRIAARCGVAEPICLEHPPLTGHMPCKATPEANGITGYVRVALAGHLNNEPIEPTNSLGPVYQIIEEQIVEKCRPVVIRVQNKGAEIEYPTFHFLIIFGFTNNLYYFWNPLGWGDHVPRWKLLQYYAALTHVYLTKPATL